MLYQWERGILTSIVSDGVSFRLGLRCKGPHTSGYMQKSGKHLRPRKSVILVRGYKSFTRSTSTRVVYEHEGCVDCFWRPSDHYRWYVAANPITKRLWFHFGLPETGPIASTVGNLPKPSERSRPTRSKRHVPLIERHD